MANLPTVNDREILNSLKNQENLLENIARSITKRDDGLTKRDNETKKDKRTIDEQQEKSTIKKILQSFTKTSATRMNAHEVQIKTFEETKIAKNIAQKTGLDIEFIRKSFEEGQKKKDRELLAQTIAGAINGAMGGSGIGKTLFGGAIAALLGGMKTIVTTIGKTLKSLLGPMLSAVVRAIASIGRLFGGKGLAAAAGAVGSLALNPFVLAAGAGAALGKFGVDYVMDSIEEKRNKEQILAAGGFASKSMKENEEMMTELEMAKMQAEFDKAVEKGIISKQTQEIVNNATDKNSRFTAMGYALKNMKIPEKRGRMKAGKATIKADIEKAGMEARAELFEKYYREEQAKLIEAAEREKDEIEHGNFAKTLEEGSAELDNSLKEFMEKVKDKVDLVGDKLKKGFKDLGTLKFYDGELDLFKGAGDLIGSLYKDAKQALDSEQDSAIDPKSMNTQVNNTNVIGGNGGQSVIPFPNATAVDGHPSLSTYLRSYGAIK